MAEVFAFVLMPFDSKFDDIYRIGIKEPASELGVQAERVDEQIFSEVILERIYRQIDAADIIVADMTSQNPNVFYEVGYAHAKQKLTILLTANSDDIPFDLKHRRHIIYSSIGNLRTNLTAELKWAIDQVAKAKARKIRVELKSVVGNLVVEEYRATGSAKFTIDLHNDSGIVSPEIEAAYFYSAKDWTLIQNDKACFSTDSDVEPYALRHFIAAPVRRLGGNSWAQVQFDTQKNYWRPFQDSYHASGRCLFRLVTTEGNFDTEFNVSVEMEEEIPF